MKRFFALFLCVLIVGAVSAVSASGDSRYADVDADTDVGKAIYAMTDRGYIEGTSAKAFSPDEPVSAADYVVMVAKALGVAPAQTEFTGTDAGYMQAALNANWFQWDQIPPDDPANFDKPISRELGANIVVEAFFGTVDYDYTVQSAKVSDFSDISGRYYNGVLGGLQKGVFDHPDGTPFRPLQDLSRGDACLWVYNALERKGDEPAPAPSASQAPAPSPTQAPSGQPIRGGVKQNGWLQVKGTQLCNESGAPVVLHGMSSHGIQWFPQYLNRQSLKNTAGSGANIFRVAMYVEQDGYMQQPEVMTNRVKEAVQHAVDLDMYVIIDWHILQDGDPMTHVDQAEQFFRKMSKLYADTPNVIYEICNEPNGNITWAGNVKPYAERIVPIIREASPRGVILIGSPMWDQDVDQAAEDPVDGTNLMYTLHFYAGTHHQALRDKANRALSLGAPIFVSEWGTSDASGSGGVYIQSSDEWIDWMKDRSISWCNWSLCDKDETSAALVPGTSPDIVWTQENLSESGRYVFGKFTYGASSEPAPPSSGPARSVTAAEALKEAGLSDGERGIIEKDGKELSGEDVVSTGCVLIIENSAGQIEQRKDIVVLGDVLGTGEMNISQLVAMSRSISGVKPLSGLYERAADVAGDGKVNIADLVQEAKLLTGGKLKAVFIAQDS